MKGQYALKAFRFSLTLGQQLGGILAKFSKLHSDAVAIATKFLDQAKHKRIIKALYFNDVGEARVLSRVGQARAGALPKLAHQQLSLQSDSRNPRTDLACGCRVARCNVTSSCAFNLHVAAVGLQTTPPMQAPSSRTRNSHSESTSSASRSLLMHNNSKSRNIITLAAYKTGLLPSQFLACSCFTKRGTDAFIQR